MSCGVGEEKKLMLAARRIGVGGDDGYEKDEDDDRYEHGKKAMITKHTAAGKVTESLRRNSSFAALGFGRGPGSRAIRHLKGDETMGIGGRR